MQPEALKLKNCFFSAVDGNWGQWQSWSQCSASCGGGEQTRVRLCSSPAPLNRGRPCPGDSSQISRCNTQACPGEYLQPACSDSVLKAVALLISLVLSLILASWLGNLIVQAEICPATGSSVLFSLKYPTALITWGCVLPLPHPLHRWACTCQGQHHWQYQ